MTGLLVRSTATNWAKGSVLAVDAGTHLAAVINIIKEHLPDASTKKPEESQRNIPPSVFSPPSSHAHSRNVSVSETNGNSTDIPTNQVNSTSPQLVLSTGPLAGFELPHVTAKANAAYFVRNLITTYLITHSHLDHISGFVINTAGFQHTSRPKRLAGLPSTIDAFKSHIFNDIIWPNLSDEDGGVGLVSYMRLAEGGNLAIGEGGGRGYIEVCDGLAVKSWSVSHGKCMHNHARHGSGSGHNLQDFNESLQRRASQSAMTPTSLQHSSSHMYTPGPCVTDSSAFFLRDDHTGHEILIFGDVEPDSLSISPRTAQVWSDAAPKIAAGLLKGILIECSYDESQSDDTLFGHLAPRHVTAELHVLAEKVKAHKLGETEISPLKRKRMSNGLNIHEESTMLHRRGRSAQQPKRKSLKSNQSSASTATAEGPTNRGAMDVGLKIDVPTSRLEAPPGGPEGKPLEGLQVIIIHVKDHLRDDPDAGQTILTQLRELDTEAGLGCEFAVSRAGTSIWL